MTVAKINSMRSRLTRLEEVYPGYSIYFITFCTHEHEAFLANPGMQEAFHNFCVQARERNVLAGRYMIMPDHVHLFVRFGGDVQISTWIKSLKNSLSKSLRHSGRQAPHWQKGYFDHLVRSEASYEEKWIYTRENPVRKGLVAASGAWPYQGDVNPLPFA